jgi:hypothetical protein
MASGSHAGAFDNHTYYSSSANFVPVRMLPVEPG